MAESVDILCPSCGVPVPTHKCRLCGATKNISAVTKNLIWMRNGRIVAAFTDEKNAYVKMAVKYGITEDKWPENFKQ